MRVVQILDAAALAAGAFIATCLGVVCLALWVHQEQAADLGVRLQPLLSMTVALAGFVVIAGAATAAVHRKSPWHWPIQGLLLGATMFIVFLLRTTP